MAANHRLFYACQRAEIAPDGSTTTKAIHGLESIGINTAFNLDPVSEFGQISLYQNIEGIPATETTLSRLLDGSCPVYLLATQQGTDPTLVGRSAAKCILHLGLWPETVSTTAGTQPANRVEMTGQFVSQVGWSFPINGHFTESTTLVGNDILWAGSYSGAPSLSAITFDSTFTANDQPLAINGSGGVNRRQHLLMSPTTNASGLDGNGALRDPDCSIFPAQIWGINASGVNVLASGGHSVIQNVNVSCSLGRDQILELGRFGIFFRYVTFPVQVTCEIEVLSSSGTMISASESGIYPSATGAFCADRYNLPPQTIRLATCEGLRMYLGKQNKLTSVNYNGGDTGGGNATNTMSYSTYNDLTVMHYNDINTSLQPTGLQGFLYLCPS